MRKVHKESCLFFSHTRRLVLRIWINWFRIRILADCWIQIQIQAFEENLWLKKKSEHYFDKQKLCIFLTFMQPSALPEANNQIFKAWDFQKIKIFCCCCPFLWDPQTPLNPYLSDPDPDPVLTSSSISSSTSLMISALNSASRSRMGFLSTLLLLTNGCCTPRSVNQSTNQSSIG